VDAAVGGNYGDGGCGWTPAQAAGYKAALNGL